MHDIVTAMPLDERNEAADPVLLRSIRNAFPEDTGLDTVTRGNALMLTGIIADRRRAMGAGDAATARYVGYELFARKFGVKAAAEIIVPEGTRATSVKGTVSTMLRTLRKRGWDDEVVKHITAHALAPDTTPEAWQELLPQVVHAERNSHKNRAVADTGKVAIVGSSDMALNNPKLDKDESLIRDVELQDTAQGNSLRTYLNAISKIPLLDSAEEVGLAKKIEAGLYAGHKLTELEEAGDDMALELRRDLGLIKREGESAKKSFLEANLALVVSFAKRKSGRGVDFLDLIQEGNVGLVRAVEKFDYTKGYKFSTYAAWWINRYIHIALEDQARTIHLSTPIVEAMKQLRSVEWELMSDGRDATTALLAQEMGVTEERILELQGYRKRTISLDQVIGHETDTTLGEVTVDDDAIMPHNIVEVAERRASLYAAIDLLPAREAAVVRGRFGLEGPVRTFDQIGEDFGLTGSRMRQLLPKAIAMLREVRGLGDEENLPEFDLDVALDAEVANPKKAAIVGQSIELNKIDPEDEFVDKLTSGMIVCAQDAQIELEERTDRELKVAGVHFWRQAQRLLFSQQFRALYASYVENKTHERIAPELGVSRQRITQLIAEAREKLHAAIEQGIDVNAPRVSRPYRPKLAALAELLIKYGETVDADTPEEELRQRAMAALGKLSLQPHHEVYMYERYGLRAADGVWLTQAEAAARAGLSKSTAPNLETRILSRLERQASLPEPRNESGGQPPRRGRREPNRPKNGPREFVRKLGMDVRTDTPDARLKEGILAILDKVDISASARAVMGQRYGLDREDGVGLTIAQTATELGISRKYVSTLESSVMSRLRMAQNSRSS